MRTVLFLLALSSALILSACSKADADIEGNVYIVKGGGDVKPAAGRTVYLVPYATPTELIQSAGEEAYATATKDLGGPELEATCRDALDHITSFRVELNAGLDEIKQRGTVPETGCSDLTTRADQLKEEMKEISDTHSDIVESLQGELEAEQVKLSGQVRRRALRLQDEALSQIQVVIGDTTSSNFGYYTISVINPTKFCVRIEPSSRLGTYTWVRFELYTKGKKVSNYEHHLTTADTEVDEYGFDTGCHIRPMSGREFTIGTASAIDDPEVKLLVEQHDLPTAGRGYFLHVPPSFVYLNKDQISLHRLTSRQQGSEIKYTTNPVNWTRLASVGSGSAENDKILTLRNRLDELQKEYDARPLVREHDVAESAAAACVRDQAEIERRTDDLLAISKAADGLSRYLRGESEPGGAIAALRATNNHYPNQDFEIPDYEDSYRTKAVGNVMATIFRIAQKVDLTIDGGYKFEQIEKGTYLLYCEYEDSFVKGFWLKPILVAENKRFDLHNADFVEESFGEYLALRFDSLKPGDFVTP